MGTFITPDGARYDLPGIDDPGAATKAMQSHPILKGRIPEGAKFSVGGTEPPQKTPTQEDTPFANVEGSGGIDPETSRYGTKIVAGLATAPLYAIPYIGPGLAGTSTALLNRGIDLAAGVQSDKPLSSEIATDVAGAYALKGAEKVLGGIWRVGKQIAGGAGSTYQGALKPSTALKRGEVQERIETGLKEGVTISDEGLAQIRSTVDEINNTIRPLVENATKQGKGVPKQRLVDALEGMKSKYTKENLVGNDYVQGIDDVINEIKSHPSGDFIPASEAQTFKQGIYKQLKMSYEAAKKQAPRNPDVARVQSLKKVASELRSGLEDIIPDIKGLNDRERRLLGLNASIERAVGRIENWDAIGLSEPLVGMAVGGSSAAGRIGGALAWKYLKQPDVRSKIAISLYNKYGMKGLSKEAKSVLSEELYRIERLPKDSNLGEIIPENIQGGDKWQELGASVYDKINRGNLGDVVPGVKQSAELGIPYENLLGTGAKSRALSPAPAPRGELPQRTSTRPSIPVPGSRNLLWQQFGKEGGNPAYSITDDEYLKAVGRKVRSKK